MPKPLQILWVKSGPLFPLNTGGRRRTHAILAELNRDHRVTYLALRPGGTALDQEEDTAPYAAEKIWIDHPEPRKNSLTFFGVAFWNLIASQSPLVLDRYRNEAFAAEIRKLDQSGRFDLIVCDFLTPAVNFDLFGTSTPTVLFQHNIESQIWKRLASEKNNAVARCYFGSQFRRMLNCEQRICHQFDGVITVSEEDAEFSRREYGLENVLGAVPTGVDTRFFSPPQKPNRQTGLIGFLGSMDWMPNIECVQFFARDILPSIWMEHPDSRFRIIGRDPAPSVNRLAETDPRIEVTGTVEDVRPHLDACEVLVVPLKSGGGTRIKIFEAMAQGVPVVSTTVGAEGLPVENGRDILIADSRGEFAEAVNRLLGDTESAANLAATARKKLVEAHGWSQVAETFAGLCRKVL